MKKGSLITIVIITAIIIFVVYVKTQPSPETPEEVVKCIGENSILYIQLGCHACKTQEDIFGENYQYLNIIDCWFEQNKCAEKQITAIPTWIIQGKKYEGVKSIETLKGLTGC